MKQLLLYLFVALLPHVCCAQLVDAKWIGCDEYTLYADYLPQFKISWTVQLDKHSDGMAVLFGGNDPRLMNRNMNILGVENREDESYVKLELDAATARLNVWRMGYTTKGKELLKTFDTGSADLHNCHTIEAHCCLGSADILLDGRKLGDVVLNPMGKGGDYIAFPQLCNIGYEMEAGQRGFIHSVQVRNYRSPYGVLYEDKAVQKIGGKKAIRKLKDPSHGAMPLLRC